MYMGVIPAKLGKTVDDDNFPHVSGGDSLVFTVLRKGVIFSPYYVGVTLRSRA